MTDPTRRVLRLLSLLQSRPVWTGPELAAELGVTVRSVRRDVDRLRELGYPVPADRGHGGGYRLGRGRRLPPLLLQPEEAVAAAVGLRLAAASGIDGLGEAALRTLTTLDQLMPPGLREEVSAVAGAVDAVVPPGPSVDADVLVLLARAVRTRVLVRLDYETRDGRRAERRIEPYRVLSLGRRWYLFAWDADRDDWRTFRLDRIHGARTTTFRFVPRPVPDVEEHVRRSVTTWAYAHTVRVRLLVPLERAGEVVPPQAGRLTADGPGACVLEAGGDDLAGIALHLVRTGFELEVLDPPELTAVLQEMGRRMLRAVPGPG
ncbi:helix-turn-helix transcriptional regulator [Kocuria oceani]|uniref:Helix-turn-helix transcriptional regulator n=1 Tax=Kocuria oceani TaxID=988827 RepID=A0ABV9TKQ5_9MICC|nr:WYL domain-containing protein [Kocuria oceani]